MDNIVKFTLEETLTKLRAQREGAIADALQSANASVISPKFEEIDRLAYEYKVALEKNYNEKFESLKAEYENQLKSADSATLEKKTAFRANEESKIRIATGAEFDKAIADIQKVLGE